MDNPFMTSSWSVRFELPKDKEKGREWSQSLSATVICDTVDGAAEIASTGKCPKNRSGYQRHLANDYGRCAFCAGLMTEVLPAQNAGGSPSGGQETVGPTARAEPKKGRS